MATAFFKRFIRSMGQGKITKNLPFTLMCGMAYCAVVFLSLLGAFLLAALLEASREVAVVLIFAGLLVGIFAGLGLNFALGPFQMKSLLDPQPLQGAGPLGECRHLVEECFATAGLRLPRLWLVEDESIYGRNVLVAGFRFGRGIFQPALFISRSVPETCTTAELRGIIFHEISHLKRNHLLKRGLLVCGAFLGSSFLCALALTLLSMVTSPEIIRHAFLLNLAVPIGATLILVRRQEISHELEADSTAVRLYGASCDALASALRRLDALNSRTGSAATQMRICALDQPRQAA